MYELYLWVYFFHEINRYFGISINKNEIFHGTESQQTPITVSCHRAFFGILQGFSPAAPGGTRGSVGPWTVGLDHPGEAMENFKTKLQAQNRCHISHDGSYGTVTGLLLPTFLGWFCMGKCRVNIRTVRPMDPPWDIKHLNLDVS